MSDWDTDYMSLTWEPPPDDGGSPVQHYLVMVKMAHAKWEQIAQSPTNSYRATGLKAGTQYEFKVITKRIGSQYHFLRVL